MPKTLCDEFYQEIEDTENISNKSKKLFSGVMLDAGSKLELIVIH